MNVTYSVDERYRKLLDNAEILLRSEFRVSPREFERLIQAWLRELKEIRELESKLKSFGAEGAAPHA